MLKYILVLLCIILCRAGEYCIHETYEAECGKDQIIMMTNATYGRMKIGKCIKDHLHLDCSKDVLHVVDRQCSGRQKCTFKVVSLRSIVPCQYASLESYLEASHQCITVGDHDKSCIERTSDTSRHNKPAYITSATSTCGTQTSPWLLQASPGQRIRIQLMDFTDAEGSYPSSCATLGYITEDIIRLNKTICAGEKSRDVDIYTSVGPEVRITFVPEDQRTRKGVFMIKYQVLGCEDMNIPSNTWYKRDGDVIELGCTETMSWRLQCVENRWKGNYKNCTGPSLVANPQVGQSVMGEMMGSMPESLSITIVLAVSILLSACVIVFGLVYYFRVKHRREQMGVVEAIPLEPPKPDYPKYNYPSATMKPVSHAATCRRVPQQRPMSYPNPNWTSRTLPPSKAAVDGTLRSDDAASQAMSWSYHPTAPPSDDLYGHQDESIYETPYETQSHRDSHHYFPLTSVVRVPLDSRPPPQNPDH